MFSSSTIEKVVQNSDLRGKIAFFMKQKGWKLKDLEQATNIHKTALSKMFNGERQFNIEHIDLITASLDLPYGTFYNDFLPECLDDSKSLKVAKSVEFAIKCFEVDLPQLGELIVDEIIEKNKKNRDIILQISEKLYEKKLYDYALRIYDKIIREEQKKTTYLAICYFRKFMILRDRDLKDQGKKALYNLLDYLAFLPDEYDDNKYNIKLDAYYRVLTFFNVMEDWENLLTYAKELNVIATTFKDEKYIGESLLYKTYALKGMGKLDKAYETIEEFSKINEYYKRISIGNKLIMLIENGRDEYINEYLKWASNEKEIYYVIPVAIEAYLKNNRLDEAKVFLNKYINEINIISKSSFILDERRNARIKYNISELYFKLNNIEEAVSNLIDAITICKRLGKTNRLARCMSLILKNYDVLTEKQKHELNNALERR
jgi:transcriptional regulator with XRE-family HTH domain